MATYIFRMPDGTTVEERNPNWVKMDPRYPSFICCNEEDAEGVILSDGEEQKQYNLRTAMNSDYETVTYEKR